MCRRNVSTQTWHKETSNTFSRRKELQSDHTQSVFMSCLAIRNRRSLICLRSQILCYRIVLCAVKERGRFPDGAIWLNNAAQRSGESWSAAPTNLSKTFFEGKTSSWCTLFSCLFTVLLIAPLHCIAPIKHFESFRYLMDWHGQGLTLDPSIRGRPGDERSRILLSTDSNSTCSALFCFVAFFQLLLVVVLLVH